MYASLFAFRIDAYVIKAERNQTGDGQVRGGHRQGRRRRRSAAISAKRGVQRGCQGRWWAQGARRHASWQARTCFLRTLLQVKARGSVRNPPDGAVAKSRATWPITSVFRSRVIRSSPLVTQVSIILRWRLDLQHRGADKCPGGW